MSVLPELQEDRKRDLFILLLKRSIIRTFIISVFKNKQKDPPRDRSCPTCMNSPFKVHPRIAVRSSKGLQLHNGMFPVKVWRANALAARRQLWEPSWGGFFPPFGWFQTPQKSANNNHAWHYCAWLQCLIHPWCTALGKRECFSRALGEFGMCKTSVIN